MQVKSFLFICIMYLHGRPTRADLEETVKLKTEKIKHTSHIINAM